jgi:hypothetical protein
VASIFHPATNAEGNPVAWADVARARGTQPHREMQWHAILGSVEPEGCRGPQWNGQDPVIGSMDPDDLDALCGILGAHAADPDHVFFGLCTIELWEESFTREELKENRLLRLPMGRDYIVLTGPLSAVDRLSNEAAGGTPNLIWPAEHAWLMASEVDFDSTLDGGSAELIRAIVESPELESWQVEPTDSLAVDADKINAPTVR